MYVGSPLLSYSPVSWCMVRSLRMLSPKNDDRRWLLLLRSELKRLLGGGTSSIVIPASSVATVASLSMLSEEVELSGVALAMVLKDDVNCAPLMLLRLWYPLRVLDDVAKCDRRVMGGVAPDQLGLNKVQIRVFFARPSTGWGFGHDLVLRLKR